MKVPTIAGLATAIAVLAVLPSAASAAQYPVSRDVGVYRAPTTASQGLGVIKARNRVDVQCWTRGQSIGGYAVWDRIPFNGGSAYVHDKYVEIPGGRSPQQAGIQQCGAPQDPPGGGWAANCKSRWMTRASTSGIGPSFAAKIRPTNRARFFANGRGEWNAIFSDLKRCVPFPALPAAQTDSMYKQLACHAMWGKHEEFGGDTWDLEANRRNVSMRYAIDGVLRHKCNW